MSSTILQADPAQSAKDAGLRYVSDTQPGFTRKRSGKGFRYVDSEGKPVRDAQTLKRIRSLVIPPAWTDVWICANPKGHVQATGRDVRKRKQSRYHPRWREVRDEAKYDRMLAFAGALPQIREQLERDLSTPGLPQRKVLATVVRLMEATHIRVGNIEYARENNSFGLTTMRGRHVHVNGSTVSFRFQGKSGVKHTIDINDRRLSRIIQRCQDIPGHELFQYVDESGDPCAIDSGDVNSYLREISRDDFTAKDFRTWAGTLLTYVELSEFEAFASEAQAKKNVVQAIAAVAKRLGNTPSVCRKCYVHPVILECYLSGALEKINPRAQADKDCAEERALNSQETSLIKLLRVHLKGNI